MQAAKASINKKHMASSQPCWSAAEPSTDASHSGRYQLRAHTTSSKRCWLTDKPSTDVSHEGEHHLQAQSGQPTVLTHSRAQY